MVYLAGRAEQWLASDTAKQDSATQAAVLLHAATIVRHYRDQQVFVSRYFLRQALLAAATPQDTARVNTVEGDSLAVDLGNLAWQELLVGNGQSALGHAREGLGLSSKQTYILVNELNAMVLSDLPDEARAFYGQHARDMVETNPAVPFPCAIERDISELARRGVATAAQHHVVSDMSAQDRASCPR